MICSNVGKWAEARSRDIKFGSRLLVIISCHMIMWLPLDINEHGLAAPTSSVCLAAIRVSVLIRTSFSICLGLFSEILHFL